MASVSEDRINLFANETLSNSNIHFCSSSINQGFTSAPIRHEIKVWIQDKSVACRRPIRLSVNREFTLGELKQCAAASLRVAIPLQRWVIQHKLCLDDAILLSDIAGPNLNAPFTLYLVQSDKMANTGPGPGTAESKQQLRCRSNAYKRKSKSKQIRVWIEDKSSTHGPVQLLIRPGARLGALMVYAKNVFGVTIPLQRWVVQNKVCTKATTLLTDIAGKDLDAPFCLYIVHSDQTQGPTENEINEPEIKEENNFSIYIELMQLEDNTLVVNFEPFECLVCMEQVEASEGVVLRQCVHMFCRECLSLAVRHCVEPEVSCPAQDCTETLQEREVRALVSLDEYERWLARGLTTAESRSKNAFHCCTSNCKGWAICEPEVLLFECPVCKHTSCIPCKAIHEGETCSDFKIRQDGTRAFLDDLLAKGDALKCPNSNCSAIIVKAEGCDYLLCSACKTGICWATKGPRWGPAGLGDVSGGCRCGVDGKKCTPTCNNCH